MRAARAARCCSSLPDATGGGDQAARCEEPAAGAALTLVLLDAGGVAGSGRLTGVTVGYVK
jgi:hypothetical protein